ncbi:MAG: DUF805 domain-containing protein [Pseudomonadota bacterium]
MGFAEAVKTAIFKRYADFQGRSRRSEFWFFFLFNVILSFGGQLIVGLFAAAVPLIGAILAILLMIISLGLIIPGIALLIRRLHDLDKSGWWILIFLIPLVNLIMMLIWFTQKGTEGDNRFGPDPTGDVAARFA